MHTININLIVQFVLTEYRQILKEPGPQNYALGVATHRQCEQNSERIIATWFAIGLNIVDLAVVYYKVTTMLFIINCTFLISYFEKVIVM